MTKDFFFPVFSPIADFIELNFKGKIFVNNFRNYDITAELNNSAISSMRLQVDKKRMAANQ